MSDAQLSRADLIRAIAVADENTVDFVARTLGLREMPLTLPEWPEARPIPVGAAERQVAPPFTKPSDLVDTPFWRAVSMTSRGDMATRSTTEDPQQDTQVYFEWRDQPAERPPFEPIANWNQLAPKVRQGLRRESRGARPDMRRLVRKAARRELIRRVPRRTLRRWGNSVVVVMDFSDRLIPFRDDQQFVLDAVSRMVPSSALKMVSGRDPDDGLVEWKRGTGVSALIEPGSLVVVLGDLGILDTRGSAVCDAWIRWGRELRRNGCHLLALVPGNANQANDRIRRVFAVQSWQQGVVRRSSSECRELAEELLIALSPAVRIEPGLLRAVRRLRPEWADASLESLVWQHESLDSRHPQGATLRDESAKDFLRQFTRRLSERQRRNVLEKIRLWRAQLDPVVWLTEVQRLSPDARRLLSDGDVADATALARWFDREAADPKQQPDVRLLDFLSRAVDRQSGAGWADEQIGPIFRRIAKMTHPDDHPSTRPFADPAEEQPGAVVRAVAISQQADQLIFESSPAGQSPLAVVHSSQDWLIVRTDQQKPPTKPPFWKTGQPPKWASDWGRDEFGAWCEFTLQAADDEDITQRMRWIPPGTFLMGSAENDETGFADERPQHQVTVSSGFWLFDTAVTQQLWRTVMSDNPSHFPGPLRPVENVSWDDTQTFLERLNKQIPEVTLTLPTEAQWEYACRAGTTTPFSFGDHITSEQVNFDGTHPLDGGRKSEQRGETVPVASLPPNPWGLFEMHGNVWEWCHDGRRGYSTEQQVDPMGSTEPGAVRVFRGGSWDYSARRARSAYRSADPPGYRYHYLGFRPALVHSEAEPSEVKPELLSNGSEAEPRTGETTPGDIGTVVKPGSQGRCSIPKTSHVTILSDVAELKLERSGRPAWACAMGRDEFGLWADLTILPQTGGSSRQPAKQRLRWINPGRFQMGSDDEEDSEWLSARPPHDVQLTRGFWLFDTPVTQALWNCLRLENPSDFSGPERPVESVTWQECADFLHELTEVCGLSTGELEFRLPTEAQWEYACRGGTLTPWSFGDTLSTVDANISGDDSHGGTCAVASYRPNVWGLFDMHGNVDEWCLDGPRDYSVEMVADPLGSTDLGAGRVIRGGSWYGSARSARSACRGAYHPGGRDRGLGFRPALVHRQASRPSEGSAGRGVAEPPGPNDERGPN